MLFLHVVARAFSRAMFNAGSSIPARIAMIAITIKSSMSVNIEGLRFMFFPSLFYFVVWRRYVSNTVSFNNYWRDKTIFWIGLAGNQAQDRF